MTWFEESLGVKESVLALQKRKLSLSYEKNISKYPAD